VKIQLPVGHQVLRLFNPLSKKETMLPVEVDEKSVHNYTGSVR
jgi:hypothetical protein